MAPQKESLLQRLFVLSWDILEWGKKVERHKFYRRPQFSEKVSTSFSSGSGLHDTNLSTCAFSLEAKRTTRGLPNLEHMMPNTTVSGFQSASTLERLDLRSETAFKTSYMSSTDPQVLIYAAFPQLFCWSVTLLWLHTSHTINVCYYCWVINLNCYKMTLRPKPRHTPTGK